MTTRITVAISGTGTMLAFATAIGDQLGLIVERMGDKLPEIELPAPGDALDHELMVAALRLARLARHRKQATPGWNSSGAEHVGPGRKH